jgi:nitroreductase
MRYGFGEQALEGLSYNLGLLRSVDSKYRENYYYKTALAALSEYVYRHRNGGYDLSRVRQLLTEDTWSDIQPRPVSGGGSLSILKTDKKKNESIPFENLFENRHSIREYSESTVADEEVMRAIRIAMKTPSVCNRQPVRIRVITNKGMIVDALKLQQGFNGYPAPPMLLLITADNKMLFSAEERNEGFVDGGLFAMSLLLSLESRQLAACPLNTMFPEERDKATRKLLGVEDTEFLVMYIAVGHFKDESKTCVSHRHAAEDIVSFLR